MKYFDEFITDDELQEIEKKECLFTKDVISLDDKKNRKLLDNFSYQNYLKESTTDNKGGGSSEQQD